VLGGNTVDAASHDGYDLAPVPARFEAGVPAVDAAAGGGSSNQDNTSVATPPSQRSRSRRNGPGAAGSSGRPRHRGSPGSETFRRDAWFCQTAAPRYRAGEPLRSPAEGWGRRRGSPDLRRLLGIAQSVLDPGDPCPFTFTSTTPWTRWTPGHPRAVPRLPPPARHPACPVLRGPVMAALPALVYERAPVSFP